MSNPLIEALQARMANSIAGQDETTNKLVNDFFKDSLVAREERRAQTIARIQELVEGSTPDGKEMDPMFKGAYARIVNNLVNG